MKVGLVRSQHGPFERLLLRFANLPFKQPNIPTSVYRVGDLLIDAGSPNAAEALVDALSLSEEAPRRIVLTHQHEDHIGAINHIRERFGDIAVYAPATHVPIISAGYEVPQYRARIWGRPQPVADLIAYESGEVFEADGVRLEAIETPGHTPGHIAFAVEHAGERYALSGDLFTSAEPVGAWYESSAECTIASCRRLIERLGDFALLTTHTRVRADGATVLGGLADWTARESDAIHALCASLGTRDYRAIAEARYGRGDALETLSKGEFSRVCMVRSVLEPVKQLPAALPRVLSID